MKGLRYVGPCHKYISESMNEVLSMLFKCLDLRVPLVYRQGELALSSIWKKVDSGAWISDSSANATSVANT